MTLDIRWNGLFCFSSSPLSSSSSFPLPFSSCMTLKRKDMRWSGFFFTFFFVDNTSWFSACKLRWHISFWTLFGPFWFSAFAFASVIFWKEAKSYVNRTVLKYWWLYIKVVFECGQNSNWFIGKNNVLFVLWFISTRLIISPLYFYI